MASRQGHTAAAIPKTLHQVWFGPRPDWFDEYQESWLYHHPSWEYHLWESDPPSKSLPLFNPSHFLNADAIAGERGHQLRADILRYDILFRFGGVYVDMDILCQKPIDELCEDVDCWAVWEKKDTWVNNAIMGAVPGHPLLRDCVFNLGESIARGNGRPNIISGPQFLTREIFGEGHSIKIYPEEYFYPYSWDELDRADEAFPNSYGVHRWNNKRKETL